MTIRCTSRHSRHSADIAQIVYLDHRDKGRSGGDDPEAWNLVQWGRQYEDVLRPARPQKMSRRPAGNHWFARLGGEGRTFNFFPALRIRCPTLVLGGEEDPIIPIESQEGIVAAPPPHLARFNCGHSMIADAHQHAFAVIRDSLSTDIGARAEGRRTLDASGSTRQSKMLYRSSKSFHSL